MKPIRYYLPESLRWRIVRLADHLPGQCWSDLCDWAGSWKDDDPEHFAGLGALPLPSRQFKAHCFESARECGSCYCGKLRDEARIVEIVASHDEEVAS